jgi:hypothetical protein
LKHILFQRETILCLCMLINCVENLIVADSVVSEIKWKFKRQRQQEKTFFKSRGTYSLFRRFPQKILVIVKLKIIFNPQVLLDTAICFFAIFRDETTRSLDTW